MENENTIQTPVPAQVIQQTPPVSPVSPKSSISRLMILVPLFIVIAVVGIVAYALGVKTQTPSTVQPPTPLAVVQPTPTPDPTANWKTYTNTVDKYSIKYPSEWKIETEGQADPATFSAPDLVSPCNYEVGDRCGQIMISAEEYQPQTSLDSYLRITTTEPWPDRIISKQTTELGSENAITMEYFNNNNFYGSGPNDHGIILQVTKAIHGSLVYSLVVSESGKDRANIVSTKDWKNKTLYNQILSTFKFN